MLAHVRVYNSRLLQSACCFRERRQTLTPVSAPLFHTEAANSFALALRGVVEASPRNIGLEALRALVHKERNPVPKFPAF